MFPIIFLLDIAVVPREIEYEGYAKFWGVNKVNYGLYENSELKKIPVQRRTHTAISRKVVGKSARDNPVRYCGWFLVCCFSKEFERMTR